MCSMQVFFKPFALGRPPPSCERQSMQVVGHPIVFGASNSVYVRAVRLTPRRPPRHELLGAGGV